MAGFLYLLLTGIGTYVLLGLWYYFIAVVRSYEFVKFWDFKVVDGHIGICPYPKWLLFWMEWIFKIFRKDDDNDNKKHVG